MVSQQTLSFRIRSPLSFAEEVGRLVIDFGFGSFLEKWEQFFGRRASRILVAALGVTIFAVCGGMIWSIVIAPLLDWTMNTAYGSTAFWYVSKVVQFALFFMLVVAAAANLAQFFDYRRTLREALEIRNEYRHLEEQTLHSIDQVKAEQAKIEEMLAEMNRSLGEVAAEKLAVAELRRQVGQLKIDLQTEDK